MARRVPANPPNFRITLRNRTTQWAYRDTVVGSFALVQYGRIPVELGGRRLPNPTPPVPHLKLTIIGQCFLTDTNHFLNDPFRMASTLNLASLKTPGVYLGASPLSALGGGG